MEKKIEICKRVEELKFLIPILGVLVLGFGYCNVIDFAILGMIMLISAFLPLEKNLLVLIFLTIFDDVLVMELLAGSILRIIMVICMVRLLCYFVKKRICPINKKNVVLWGCLSFFWFVGLITNGISMQSFMICVNIGMLLLYGVYFNTYKQDELEDTYKELVYILVSAVMVSCIYGVLHFGFLIESSHGYQIARFNGVFEPNFMCTYLNMGLVSVFLNKEFFSKKIGAILVYIFTLFACLTVSISGLALLALIYIYYIFCDRKRIWKRIQFTACMFVLSVLSFVGINKGIGLAIDYINSNIVTDSYGSVEGEYISDNTNITLSEDTLSEGNMHEIVVSEGNPLIVRVKSLINDVKNANFDELTSGRTALVREFFDAAKQRTGIEALFGNGLDTKMIHSDFFGKEKYSHNTYIDLIFNFGWIGSAIVFFFIIKKTYTGMFINISNPDIQKRIRVLRLCCLFAALTLSIYSRRLFLLFFIL